MSRSELTLLVCDDHRLFREGLSALIARVPGWRVVAEAADGAEAVTLAAEHRPDVAVLDVAMPGVGGIEAAAEIRKLSPRTRIVALSMYADDFYLKRMLSAGASAYVLKNEASADLIRAIEAVMEGKTFVSPALAHTEGEGVARNADLDLGLLSEREREVLQMLAAGRRTKEIGVDLGISAKTVETYRARLMTKLRIENLAGLVRFAIRAGIAPRE
jgi:DNA-binding NarL/FixJ family response regulator